MFSVELFVLQPTDMVQVFLLAGWPALLLLDIPMPDELVHEVLVFEFPPFLLGVATLGEFPASHSDQSEIDYGVTDPVIVCEGRRGYFSRHPLLVPCLICPW